MKIFFSLLFLISSLQVFAQQPEVLDIPLEPFQRPGRIPGIYGKVLDIKTNKGIQSAAVEIYIPAREAGTHSDSLVTGTLTRPNGDFNFSRISLPDSFRIKITAIGFGESWKLVTIHQEEKNLENSYRDLGNIKLDVEAVVLTGVTVVAQKPTLSMGIDRKIFNADKSITSAGGTAIDMMRNIPSVTVDAEGNVQLRNISPQIYVDGRPTILTCNKLLLMTSRGWR